MALIQVYVGFNELVGYLIAGFTLSITEFAFKEPEEAQKPQKSKKQNNHNQQKKKRKK